MRSRGDAWSWDSTFDTLESVLARSVTDSPSGTVGARRSGWHDVGVATFPPPLDSRVESVRHAIADALRNAVAGDDAEARRAAIIDAPGERWFAPDSTVVRVHSDSAMFIGGLRALLIQSLHPLAMAGVAQHSDYRNDPWGRLQRTAEFIAATTFGPDHVAQHAVDRVNAVHRTVTGTAADGRAYSASDPHLLRWVHVTEIDSFLRAHQEYGERPLTPAECDDYVRGMAVVARKLGVNAPPESHRGLRDQIAMFRGEVHATPESHEVVRWLLVQPPVPAAARIPYALVSAAAVALLPAWARAELRLPWVPAVDTLIARPTGRLVARTIRWAAAVDPSEPGAN